MIAGSICVCVMTCLTVIVSHALAQNMLSILQFKIFSKNINYRYKSIVIHLKGLFCQIPLPLDFDVKASRNVWDKDVNQLADTKHNMLKDDHKGKLDSQDLPVNWGKESLIIPEASVETFRLKKKFKSEF